MTMHQRLASLVAAILILAAAGLPVEARAPARPVSTPSANVVGDGHPGTCTAAALFAALDLGGAITFNCGAAPLAILFSTAKTVTTTASLNGGDLITLSGNNVTRLFFVSSGRSLTLSHITLSNAKFVGDGGAIFNDTGASLIVDHTTFLNNKTDPAYSGGAILNLGTLTISDSTFDSNQAGNGGALFPRFTASSTAIANSLFIHNSTLNTTNGWGGALLVWDGAPVTVNSTTFISNTARWGGALYLFHGGSTAPPTTVTLTNSLLTNNLADGGSTTVDGGGGAIYNNARLVLMGTSLENNLTVVPPGTGFTGIRAGGAIWNSSQGVVQMTGGELRGNRALQGGALYGFGNGSITSATLADNLAGRGGAIENANNAGNSLTISATTFSGNQVSFALYPSITTPLGSAIFNTAHLAVTNSTFSGNSGDTAINEDNSVITLTNVTLAQNPNGGLGSDQGPNTSQVHLFNTLLSANSTYNCGPIYFGTFTSQNSLSSNNTCNTWVGADNQNGVDPRLSALGNHGGPTLTYMLTEHSPALDAGANCPPIDQRGVIRPQGAVCDIGATEGILFSLFLPLLRR
jgi:hypothetical protein